MLNVKLYKHLLIWFTVCFGNIHSHFINPAMALCNIKRGLMCFYLLFILKARECEASKESLFVIDYLKESIKLNQSMAL